MTFTSLFLIQRSFYKYKFACHQSIISAKHRRAFLSKKSTSSRRDFLSVGVEGDFSRQLDL